MSEHSAHYPRELQEAEAALLAKRVGGLKQRLAELVARRDAADTEPGVRLGLDGRCRALTRQIERIEARHGRGKLVGLALSGGGMRSATFSLGFLQSLARLNLLREVDVLSTVSGGSYIGGFLGALYDRTARDTAAGAPARAAWDVEEELCNPRSKVVHWLRDNGRYLSPAGASDGWMALAVILRNMAAVNFMLWSFVFTVFVLLNLGRGAMIACLERLPEVDALLLRASVTGPVWWSPSMLFPAVVVPLFLIPLGLAYWLVIERKSDRNSWLLRRIALLTNCGILAGASVLVGGWAVAGWREGAGVTGVVIGIESLLGLVMWALADAQGEPRHRLTFWLKTWLLVFVVLLAAAVLDSVGQTAYVALIDHVQGKALVGMLVGGISGLLALAMGGQKLIGLIGSKDSNKGNKGGVIGVPLQVVALAGALLLLVPPVVGLSALSHGVAWAWQRPIPAPVAQVAVAATEEEREKLEAAGIITESAPAEPTGPITLELEAGGTLKVKSTSKEAEWPPLRDPPVDWVWALVTALGGLGVCIGFGHAYSFLNNSSIASLYAARLTRAYLGASNRERLEGNQQDKSSTDLLPSDRIDMSTYSPEAHGGPLHIINTTLNETVGGQSRVEERDRKGMNLAFGPGGISVAARHHAVWIRGEAASGTAVPPRIALRSLAQARGGFHVFPSAVSPGDDKETGGERRFQPEMLDLGRWVAISGAAASTALGSMTSLGLSLLCGLLNVRLGHWWWSDVDPRTREVQPKRGTLSTLGRLFSRRFPVQAHLIDELLARFPGTASRNWYLTDGGHFENTGVYELIRREVAVIVLLDNGADPELVFEDVGGLVRKARVDFGAEIEFDGQTSMNVLVGDLQAMGMTAPGADRAQTTRYASIATIRYASGGRGKLLLVKPGVVGGEALDILHYRAANNDFPQQTTADQFFDEAQWESYRKLGATCGETLFRDPENPVGRALFDELAG